MILNTVKYIPRQKWGALPPKRGHYEVHVPSRITIHHYLQDFNPRNRHIKTMQGFYGAETMRELQKHDMVVEQFYDIRYHAVVDLEGNVWEGRDFGLAGAHLKHNNKGNLGILVFGNFEIELPTIEQLVALKRLIIELSTIFPEIQLPRSIFAHREFSFTECPGLNMYHLLMDIKYGVRSFFDDLDCETW